MAALSPIPGTGARRRRGQRGTMVTARVQSVRVGMARRDVIALLGGPDATDADARAEPCGTTPDLEAIRGRLQVADEEMTFSTPRLRGVTLADGLRMMATGTAMLPPNSVQRHISTQYAIAPITESTRRPV